MKKKITPIEEALMSLAWHVGNCPYSAYKVEHEIAEILGLEKITKVRKSK